MKYFVTGYNTLLNRVVNLNGYALFKDKNGYKGTSANLNDTSSCMKIILVYLEELGPYEHCIVLFEKKELLLKWEEDNAQKSF